MLARQLDRFLDAQSEDTVAVWIVLELLIRRLDGQPTAQSSTSDREEMLRSAMAARLKIARTDVWN